MLAPSAFLGWQHYDDEGYLLASFRSFTKGPRPSLRPDLYRVPDRSQYAVWWLLLRPLGTDMQLDRWSGHRPCCLAASGRHSSTVRRMTGSTLGVVGAVAVGSDLYNNFHDLGARARSIGLLLVLLALALTMHFRPPTGAMQGVLLGALFLTKVNVGTFVVRAFVVAMAVAASRPTLGGAPRVARLVLPVAAFVARWSCARPRPRRHRSPRARPLGWCHRGTGHRGGAACHGYGGTIGRNQPDGGTDTVDRRRRFGLVATTSLLVIPRRCTPGRTGAGRAGEAVDPAERLLRPRWSIRNRC